MKVYPRYIKSFWKKGIVQFLAILSLGIFNACDFDIPDKFEMPIWELELKIPLVQTRYEMTDISNPDAGIFPTDDSLGFKIVQEGTDLTIVTWGAIVQKSVEASRNTNKSVEIIDIRTLNPLDINTILDSGIVSVSDQGIGDNYFQKMYE